MLPDAVRTLLMGEPYVPKKLEPNGAPAPASGPASGEESDYEY